MWSFSKKRLSPSRRPSAADAVEQEDDGELLFDEACSFLKDEFPAHISKSDFVSSSKRPLSVSFSKKLKDIVSIYRIHETD